LSQVNDRLLFQFWSWIMLTYIMGIPWFFGYFNQFGEGWQWAFISLNLSSGLIIFYETLPLPNVISLSKEDFDKNYPSLPVIGLREDDFDDEDFPAPCDSQNSVEQSTNVATSTTGEGIETAKQ